MRRVLRPQVLSWPLGAMPVPAQRAFFGAMVSSPVRQSPVPAALVKELRDRTGASMGKCREALKEESGDVEKAVEWLRRRGIKSMEKRATDAVEALLAVSSTNRSAAIVELRCETDFVTRSTLFQQLSLAVAHTASAGSADDLAEGKLEGAQAFESQMSAGASVGQALLELGSVLGERLHLGKAARLEAKDGVVAAYVHPKFADSAPGTGKIAALVALRAVGGSPDLNDLAQQLARHIVAVQPSFLSIDAIPKEVLEKEQETLKAAHLATMDPARAAKATDEMLKKVIDGKTKKWHADTVLMCQELLQNTDDKAVSVEAWLKREAKNLGVEQLVIDDFKLICL